MSECKNTSPILQLLLAGATKLFWAGPEIQEAGFDGEPRTRTCCHEVAAAAVVLAWFRGGHNAEDHEALAAELKKMEHPGYVVSAWEVIFSPLVAWAIGWIITQMEADKKLDAESWDRYAHRITLEANPEG